MNLLKLFPKKIIHREDGQEYLIRWTLLNFFGLFKIRLHHIKLSDADCVHDHPWDFITFVLKGGYIEWLEAEYRGQLYTHDPKPFHHVYKERKNWMYCQGAYWRGPGAVLVRGATTKHRIELFPERTSWSLVIMFRRKRLWGFWTKLGFIPWFNYSSTQSCD